MESPVNLWRVVALVLFAMLVIVGGDAAAKALGQAGFRPAFVAWARFAFAAVILFPMVGLKRSELQHFSDWRLYLRAGLIVGGITCILTALKTEPMANVFGGFFIGPVVAYGLSVRLLRERVTVARTLLLLVSFVGVLIVVRPGVGMSQGMVLALIAGCFHGSYLVATRWLAGEFRPRFLLYSQLLIGTVLMSPLAIGPVPQIGLSVGVLLFISALGSAIGNLILVAVNKTTPATIIAPLIYSQIIAATGFGWVIFGNVPDGQTIFGLVIVITAGASSVWFAGRGR